MAYGISKVEVGSYVISSAGASIEMSDACFNSVAGAIKPGVAFLTSASSSVSCPYHFLTLLQADLCAGQCSN